MAYTSGSYNTNKYSTSSSGTIGLNLSWTLKSQSVVNNTSTISWTLKSNGTMSTGYYVQAGPVTVTINGTKVLNTTSRFSMYGGGKYKKTGTITVTHGADGKKSVGFKVEAALYSASVNCKYKTDGSTDYRELPQIYRYAQISSATDFTNNLARDGYPTIVYTNPAGTSLTTGLRCRITWDGGATDWVTLNDEGGTYTFTSSTLTSANITSMLNASSSSNILSVTYVLESTFNETTYTDYYSAVMDVVDSNPTMSGQMTYLDVNSTTVGKTGDSSVIVQSQSTLRVRVPTATALNGASIDVYNLDINNNVYVATVSGGYAYVDFVNPSLSGEFPATMTAFDTRGNSVSLSGTVIVQPWEAPTALFTLSRVNGFYTNSILYVDASISSVSNTNTLTIQEQHRKSGESNWSTATIVQNKTNTTISLDNTYAWEMQILVQDEYATTTYYGTVGKGIPIMFIDKDKNSIGVNGYPDANNQIYVDGTIKSTGMVTCEDINPTVVSTDVISECIANYGTTCTINGTFFRRAGRLCQLSISAKRNSNCGSGGNILAGELGSVSMPFAPDCTVTCGGYYGGRCVGFSIDPEGNFIIRNASSQTLPSGASFGVSINWLYAGPLPPLTS